MAKFDSKGNLVLPSGQRISPQDPSFKEISPKWNETPPLRNCLPFSKINIFFDKSYCPEDFKSLYLSFKGNQNLQMRVVCDFIGGMTDRYALDQYKQFFEPYERV